MSDVHPDLASAEFQAAVVFEIAEVADRATTLGALWGPEAQAAYFRRSAGLAPGDADWLFEEMCAEEMKRPRPGPRGILGDL
jgi:hypothetical protein